MTYQVHNLVFEKSLISSDDDIELSFQQGDMMIVEHMNQATPEWCTCTLHGRKGLVPLSYVEVVDEVEAAAHLEAMSYC